MQNPGAGDGVPVDPRGLGAMLGRIVTMRLARYDFFGVHGAAPTRHLGAGELETSVAFLCVVQLFLELPNEGRQVSVPGRASVEPGTHRVQDCHGS